MRLTASTRAEGALLERQSQIGEIVTGYRLSSPRCQSACLGVTFWSHVVGML